MGCYLSSVLLVFSSLRSIFPAGGVDILWVVTAVTITKESYKVGLYIVQTVFRGHGCEEKAIADGVAVGGQHGC